MDRFGYRGAQGGVAGGWRNDEYRNAGQYMNAGASWRDYGDSRASRREYSSESYQDGQRWPEDGRVAGSNGGHAGRNHDRRAPDYARAANVVTDAAAGRREDAWTTHALEHRDQGYAIGIGTAATNQDYAESFVGTGSAALHARHHDQYSTAQHGHYGSHGHNQRSEPHGSQYAHGQGDGMHSCGAGASSDSFTGGYQAGADRSADAGRHYTARADPCAGNGVRAKPSTGYTANVSANDSSYPPSSSYNAYVGSSRQYSGSSNYSHNGGYGQNSFSRSTAGSDQYVKDSGRYHSNGCGEGYQYDRDQVRGTAGYYAGGAGQYESREGWDQSAGDLGWKRPRY